MDEYRKLFDLSGRRALVVGAGSGIGEASAMGLAAFGAHVVCGDLDLESASRTADSIRRGGGSAEEAEVDLLAAHDVTGLLEKTGPPDGLGPPPGGTAA